jgi:hypothetical protein
VSYFVKLLGSSDFPMPDDAFDRDPEMSYEVRFPKGSPPSDVAPGDELVYYAVGGFKRIFASARVDGPAVLNAVHSNPEVARRWPYAAPVSLRPETRLDRVSAGPELAEVGPGLQQKVGHGVSHFEIGRAEFDRALSLLRKAKLAEAARAKAGASP